MTMPKISVIVPIYNLEKYLKECLDSIVNQTIINDLEVILVDDESTDRSRYIVEEYALDYDNFHAYHKSNGGLGDSRNFGLEFAKGEYVYFMDADDLVAPNALEKLYDMAKKHDHDVVSGMFTRFNDDSIWDTDYVNFACKDINQDIEFTHFREYPNLVWDVAVWNKIFKRDFIEKHKFRFPIGLHEDNIFVMKSYYLAKSIGIIKDNVYFYRFREESLSNRASSPQDIDDRVRMLNDVYQFMDSTIEEEDIKKMIFQKFLSMDFDAEAHHIINGNLNYCKEIGDLIKIIELIPEESINDLSTYRRLLIRTLQNEDFENLSYVINNYSRLISISEQEARKNIDERYIQYFNIEHDLEIARLIPVVYKIIPDSEKYSFFVLITRELCPKHDYEIKAKLIRKDGPVDLEVKGREEIILPIDLIDENYSKIKIEYSYKDTYMEEYVQYVDYESLDYGNFDITFISGVNNELNLLRREKNQNKIRIDNIVSEGSKIFLTGKSGDCASLFLVNDVDFEKVDLKTEFKSDNEFTATVNYADLLNRPVKKWKLKADLYNSIQLAEDNRSLYFDIYKVGFFNNHNEISIECRRYDMLESLNSYDEELSIAEKRNKQLEVKNRKLRKTIESYKSRRAVKFGDKLHGFLK